MFLPRLDERGTIMSDEYENLEEYRDYLGLLGRLQLNDKLAEKVDVSGVVQMTFLEAHQEGWAELLEDEQLPWLRRVFANNLLDEIRKFRTQRRDIGREQSIHQNVEQSASRINNWLAAEQASPSQIMMRAESSVKLAKALACLTAEQREAIELHHLKGLSLEEIGKRMKRRKGAVAGLIFRGKRRLLELLGSSG